MNTVCISLGYGCFPAVWATHNRLRSSKADGYKTCVFDLMVSNYNGVVKCILEDFKNFTDPKFLHYTATTGENILNSYYNFQFNHETPGHANLYIQENWPGGKNHFVDNNFAHFIERYKARINNFINYLQTCEFITFVIEFFDTIRFDKTCKDLCDALALKYPKLNYKIIIITGKQTQPRKVEDTTIVSTIQKPKDVTDSKI